jgi:N-acyl-D-amino-acid deacylase
MRVSERVIGNLVTGAGARAPTAGPAPGRRTGRRTRGVVALVLLVAACAGHVPRGRPYDVVIENVRYLDGERFTTAPYAVAIDGDRIAAIGRVAPPARLRVAGTGLVLAPGFVDTNSGGFVNGPAAYLKAADGITTYLSAHGGAVGERLADGDAPPWLNYATTVGIGGWTPAEGDVIEHLAAGLAAGAYGIALSPEYNPAATPELMARACAYAAAAGVPVSLHLRYSDAEHELEGVAEAVRCAEQGAAVHVLHFTSTGGTFRPRDAAAMIAQARARGRTIFFDFYPYTSWASPIAEDRFAGDWTRRYRIGWDKVRMPGSKTPLNEAHFAFLRARHAPVRVVVEGIPRATVDFVALETDASLGTDSTATGLNHPRGAGGFTKFIDDYVETGKVSFAAALHRFSTRAAARFAPYVPGLRERGRIAVGAVADLVLWDEQRIQSNATIERPRTPSSGVVAAFVNGTPLILDRAPVTPPANPGRWLKGRVAAPPHR